MPEMIQASLNKNELALFKDYALRGRACADRISIALAVRLLDTSDPYFDPFSVLNELDYLEGLPVATRTKSATQFDRTPLFPLWHKHFLSARHIPKNITIRWALDRGGNSDLSAALETIAVEHGANADAWQDQLVHRLISLGFAERLQYGATGDWIIFGMHQGQNYYLDLATHEQGTAQHSATLLKRIKNGSLAEFPFLFD